MAYTLNSAKDSRGDEHLFVENAQKNRAAITAYKQKHGGDFEGAYRAVTGQPWPSGRSLKFDNGRFTMTKDRTVKSVLGKYVAPIAGAVAAPYLLPLLAGGGAAAGGAAAASGAGAAGAGTAATLGSVAATGGGAMSWLRPLLQYGVPAATGLVGQHMANSADERAAGIQNEFLDKALEVEKEKEQYGRGQRADYLSRLQPYGDAGQAAVGRASQLLTTSRYRPEVQGVGAVPGRGMVRLSDSRGQIREVPETEAQKYLSLGATRV